MVFFSVVFLPHKMQLDKKKLRNFPNVQYAANGMSRARSTDPLEVDWFSRIPSTRILEPSTHSGLSSPSLTWNLKVVRKRNLLFQGCHFQVSYNLNWLPWIHAQMHSHINNMVSTSHSNTSGNKFQWQIISAHNRWFPYQFYLPRSMRRVGYQWLLGFWDLLLHPCLAHAQTRLPKQLVYHSECLSPCKGMAEFGFPHLLWEKTRQKAPLKALKTQL